jgi:hypothetical protein
VTGAQAVSGVQGTSSRSRSTARMLMPSSHSTRRISPRSYRFTSCSRRLHITMHSAATLQSVHDLIQQTLLFSLYSL